MNELIPLDKSAGGKDVVSGRLLHEFLESKQDFTDWIKGRIQKYGFEVDVDFTIILGRSENNRQTTEYVLTLDMAKELAMLEGNAKGQQARRYFIEKEKELRAIKPPLTLPSYPEALRLLADEVEQKQQLQKQLDEARPDVELVAALTSSEQLYTMEEVAKTLAIPGLGRNNLFDLLRETAVVLPNSTLPYQQYVDQGYFVVRQVPFEVNGKKKTGNKTLVTVRGVGFIRRLIDRRGKQAA